MVGKKWAIYLSSSSNPLSTQTCYTIAALCNKARSISWHSSQRSEFGRQLRFWIITRGYCLQFLYQCHLSGSGPLTYSSTLTAKQYYINRNIFNFAFLSWENLGNCRLPLLMMCYFDLPAFFAQASLQYFDLALNVV